MLPFYKIKSLPGEYIHIQPDGSEIRLLPEMTIGGLYHCTLPFRKILSAVRHKTISEIWYCIAGMEEIWQSREGRFETGRFALGHFFTIPLGDSIQFRNIGLEPLKLVFVINQYGPGRRRPI